MTKAAVAKTWSAWNPMSTAPKDGRDILVHRKGAKRYPVVGVDYWSETLGSRPGWAKSPYDEQPTHWMHLPDPPQE